VPQLHPEVDQLLASERLTAFNTPATNQRKKAAVAKRDWAHVVDVSKEMRNFHQLVPDMAKTYPFELDNFQREAVYHMESGDSVFVAAHTSAGKTVVAEYAIALAIKHMTRFVFRPY
jgi:antiviral helicase SKI2